MLSSWLWIDINGFSDDEIERYKEVIESTAHLIIEFAKEGGYVALKKTAGGGVKLGY